MLKIKKAGRLIRQLICSRPPRIAYIAGWNQHSNLGDEAVYDGLRRLFYPASFVDYPKGLKPDLTLRFLHYMKAGMLAGGTLIGGKVSTAQRVRECFGRCPCSFVFGTGVNQPGFWTERIGPVEWRQSEQQWKELLRGCRYVGVRGPMSAEVLTNWGLDVPEVIGDPVVAFSKERLTNGLCVRNTLGLNVAQTKGNIWGGNQNKLYEQFVFLARLARQNNWYVKWFVLWPKDLPIVKSIAMASDTEQEVYKIYQDYNIYLGLVDRLDVFVGMRLHSVALATCAYVPSIMVEYQPKCRDYMMSIGQEQAVIRADRFKAGDVWEMICDFSRRRNDVSLSLFQAIRPLCKKQYLRAKELMDICGIQRGYS